MSAADHPAGVPASEPRSSELRAAKSALLLMRLGVATEPEVFPHGRPPAPQLFSMADLRRATPEPATGGWMGGFFTGKRSPIAARAPAALRPKSPPAKKKAAPPVAKPNPPPPLVLRREWTDAEADRLPAPAVKLRGELLELESSVHNTLAAVEAARATYLVPARRLACDAESLAVARCFDYFTRQRDTEAAELVVNAAAAAAAAAAGESPAAPGPTPGGAAAAAAAAAEALEAGGVVLNTSTAIARGPAEAPSARPRLRASILGCSSAVAAFEKCALTLADDHVAALPEA